MNESPYVLPMDYGMAEIHAPWPFRCGPRQLRGAVITTLSEKLTREELTPWCGRNSSGDTVQGPPIVSYRVHRDGPAIFVVGPTSGKHLGQLAEYLDHLTLPDGQLIDVRRIPTQIYHGEIRKMRSGWARYELSSPYFPSANVDQRRPSSSSSWANKAWASFAIESSLRTWMEHWGLAEVSHRPIHVQVDELRMTKVSWERPARGKSVHRVGFWGSFTTSLVVPQGVAIGSKASEGFGELKLVDIWEGRHGAH